MTVADQEPPINEGSPGCKQPWATLMEAWMRGVQAYDVESGLCTFNGMHANAGFLPVLPGPCGMFRAKATSCAIIGRVSDCL